MFKNAYEIEKEFIKEFHKVRALTFDSHVKISVKIVGQHYTLRVNSQGKFDFDFSCENAWEFLLQEFLTEAYFQIMEYAGRSEEYHNDYMDSLSYR